MSIKVDHAGVCGYALAALQQAFASAGLRAEYGGAHATGGTHNALLGFDDGSYIELIAPQHASELKGPAAEEWWWLKPDRARACFWAVDVPDIRASVKRVREAGIEISDPLPGSRKKPDGTLLAWETSHVEESKGGDILPFFIQDKTARSARIQPSASVKGSELTGIDVVMLAVKDLDASIALFRRAYGVPAPAVTNNSELAARMAYFAESPVLLVTPLEKSSWLTAQLEKFGQGPVALLIRSRDFAASEKRFKLSGQTTWFGRKVAWFDADKLQGARLGIIE